MANETASKRPKRPFVANPGPTGKPIWAPVRVNRFHKESTEAVKEVVPKAPQAPSAFSQAWGILEEASTPHPKEQAMAKLLHSIQKTAPSQPKARPTNKRLGFKAPSAKVACNEKKVTPKAPSARVECDGKKSALKDLSARSGQIEKKPTKTPKKARVRLSAEEKEVASVKNAASKVRARLAMLTTETPPPSLSKQLKDIEEMESLISGGRSLTGSLRNSLRQINKSSANRNTRPRQDGLSALDKEAVRQQKESVRQEHHDSIEAALARFKSSPKPEQKPEENALIIEDGEQDMESCTSYEDDNNPFYGDQYQALVQNQARVDATDSSTVAASPRKTMSPSPPRFTEAPWKRPRIGGKGLSEATIQKMRLEFQFEKDSHADNRSTVLNNPDSLYWKYFVKMVDHDDSAETGAYEETVVATALCRENAHRALIEKLESLIILDDEGLHHQTVSFSNGKTLSFSIEKELKNTREDKFLERESKNLMPKRVYVVCEKVLMSLRSENISVEDRGNDSTVDTVAKTEEKNKNLAEKIERAFNDEEESDSSDEDDNETKDLDINSKETSEPTAKFIFSEHKSIYTDLAKANEVASQIFLNHVTAQLHPETVPADLELVGAEETAMAAELARLKDFDRLFSREGNVIGSACRSRKLKRAAACRNDKKLKAWVWVESRNVEGPRN